MKKRLITWGVLSVLTVIAVFITISAFPDVPAMSSASVKGQNTIEPSTIEGIISSMTPKDKVKQLFIWGVAGPTISDETLKELEELQPGGILILGDLSRTEVLQTTARLKTVNFIIPPFIAIDQEGGLVQRFVDDELSDPASLAAKPADIPCEEMKASGRWLEELGVNVNFGIVADIAWDEDSYIASRSYGNTAEIVSRIVQEKVTCSAPLLSTVKHFPGHGRTTVDSHTAIPEIDIIYNRWRKSDAVPFVAAIASNVDFIMMGHIIYPSVASEPASLNRKWVDEARNLGFKGIVVTDDLGMLEYSGYTAEQVIQQAIAADNDMLLYSDSTATYSALLEYAEKAIQEQKISQKDLDAKMRKILQKKIN